MKTKLINSYSGADLTYTNHMIATFLHEHLDKYRDKVEDITKALEYTQRKNENLGGFVLLGLAPSGEIIGAVVVNETNMSGYIPENILVYIAVHKDHRGTGVGKKLMLEAMKCCTGDIALHVEANNPARFLYEKLGFTNPYLEMRLKRKKETDGILNS